MNFEALDVPTTFETDDALLGTEILESFADLSDDEISSALEVL